MYERTETWSIYICCGWLTTSQYFRCCVVLCKFACPTALGLGMSYQSWLTNPTFVILNILWLSRFDMYDIPTIELYSKLYNQLMWVVYLYITRLLYSTRPTVLYTTTGISIYIPGPRLRSPTPTPLNHHEVPAYTHLLPTDGEYCTTTVLMYV